MSDKSPLPPLGLYVHIPWCVRKCPYCDFNSHTWGGRLDEEAYVAALLADLEQEVAWAGRRRLDTLFIGGGTPSLFSAGAIERLLTGVRRQMECPSQMEVTLEANPGTLEAGRFAAYREAGVTRLSIGVQSFDADCLTRLGRIHGPDEAVAAVESAKRAGFDRLNIDLMFGLPGQTPEAAVRDVEQALQLRPDHLSYYQLTLEPNTLFYQQPPDRLPGEAEEELIQHQGQARLNAAGFQHYEVSAFALEGGRCRHNLNYWQFGDYLAIGAGAHGKLTRTEPWRVHRRWRVRGPADYMAQVQQNKAVAGERRLDESDRVMEFMMNALRLQEGFAVALFVRRTGLPEACLLDRLSRPVERGLLEVTGGWVKTTELGARFLDDLLASLL